MNLNNSLYVKDHTAIIEKAAAMALLNRGIAFRIPAPWILMLFGIKTVRIKVRRLFLGTLVHLSTLEQIGTLENISVPSDRNQVIKDIGSTPRSLSITTIVEQSVPVCRAISSCLLNSRIKIFLFSKPLGRYLRRNCHPDQLQELIMWLFVYGRAESFTTTTKFLRRMMMMKPMNLGQI